MAQPLDTTNLNAFLANRDFDAPFTRLIAPATPAAPEGLGIQLPLAQNPPPLGGLFAPDVPGALGGSRYFGDGVNQAVWGNPNNVQTYAGMYDANNYRSESMIELIVQGETLLWPVNGAPPRPDDNTLAAQRPDNTDAGVARATQIATLGYDINNQAEAQEYDNMMINAAVGLTKQILRNRIYSLAYIDGWRALNTTAELIQMLDIISQQIARALDNAAPGGQAQAGLAPLQQMLIKLVNHMAGNDVPQSLQEADALVAALNQQENMGNISQLLGGTLRAEIQRLRDALQAHQTDAAANGRPNPVNNVPGQQPGPAESTLLVGGRKSKKTRKSKTRKAKKAGKKRKGGYKFTRAANSKRSLRMKTRKLKSLTQKSPKKKNAKKHGKKYAKKHGKKHGKKSKYHKARSGKHKRGKR